MPNKSFRYILTLESQLYFKYAMKLLFGYVMRRLFGEKEGRELALKYSRTKMQHK